VGGLYGVAIRQWVMSLRGANSNELWHLACQDLLAKRRWQCVDLVPMATFAWLSLESGVTSREAMGAEAS
jgi:hypothetical protein